MCVATAAWSAPPDLQLPTLPTPVVVPTPMPPPDAPTKLKPGQFFVVGSSVELLVEPICGPGSVSIKNQSGRLLIPAELAVGYPIDPTNPDFVTFDKPYLYVIKAGAVGGRVVVEMIPTTNALDADKKPIPLKRSDITRRVLEIDTGEPVPKIDPVAPPPKPKPDVPAPVTSFRVVLVYESTDTLPANVTGVLYARAVEEFLTANCTGGRSGWDRRDKDTATETDATPLKDVWPTIRAAVTTTPCVAIVVNNRVTLEPFPKTVPEMITLLKSYAGGK